MSASVLKTPLSVKRPVIHNCSTTSGGSTLKFHYCPRGCYISGRSCRILQNRLYKFSTFSVDGTTAQNRTVTDDGSRVIGSEPDSEDEGSTHGAASVDTSTCQNEDPVVEESTSAVISSLFLYKEAFANNDELKVAEIESFLKTMEDEKTSLEKKVQELGEELLYKKDLVLRISVAFDAFRKQTESERLSLVTNARGEVVESLLPVLDIFAQVETQVKVGNEGEAKIDSSYRSIKKQFMEIVASFDGVPKETVEEPIDSNVAFTESQGFNRVIAEFFGKLNKVYSSFAKTWSRF